MIMSTMDVRLVLTGGEYSHVKTERGFTLLSMLWRDSYARQKELGVKGPVRYRGPVQVRDWYTGLYKRHGTMVMSGKELYELLVKQVGLDPTEVCAWIEAQLYARGWPKLKLGEEEL